jgi:hypothetical protein
LLADLFRTCLFYTLFLAKIVRPRLSLSVDAQSPLRVLIVPLVEVKRQAFLLPEILVV